jgi:hypothetical protein
VGTEIHPGSATSSGGFITKLALLCCAISLAIVAFALAPSGASAFGVSGFTYSNSTLQAGGHPDTTIAFNRTGSDSEDLKDLQLDLPTGVFANPESANPKCTNTQFQADACPANSHVGSASTTVKALGLLDLTIPGEVDVLTSDPNQVATLGITLRPDSICILFVFCAQPQKIFLKTGITVRSYEDSGLRTYTPGTPRSAVIGIPLVFVTPTINGDITVNKLSLSFQSRAGTPTTKRVCGGFLNLSCSDVAVPPAGPYFFRQAGQCVPATANIKLISYQNATASASSSFTPTGCDQVQWNPQFTFRPANNKGGVSTPVTFTLNIPEDDKPIQDSLPKIVDADFPNGSGLDLSALSGVTGCTEDQLKANACPASSIIGTANAFSKYLPAATNPTTNPGLVGNVYAMGVGNQIPIAVVLVGPGNTIVIFRGTMGTRGDANAGTGRVYSTFDRIPQLPFRQFSLTINKTVFKNPTTCGPTAFTSTAAITAFNGTVASGGNGTKVTRTDTSSVVNCDPEPNTTITQGPGAVTPINTPSFSFTSSIAGSLFQCRYDGAGSFIPCSSPTTSQPLSEGPHYFEVRAVNGATTDATPARVDFVVDSTGIDITPTITVSSTQAAAHPSLTASFAVAGGQPKQIALRLPAGFNASLSAVPQCSNANAAAGTCAAASSLGTASVTAQILGGTETGTGNIYLTQGPTGADAAGVAGNIHFSFGDLIVQGGAYLVENGKYQYIDLRSIPTTVGSTQINVTNLTTNFTGANKFLTNPSSCTNDKSWVSSGTDWAGNNAAVFNVPFQATGCASVPFAPTINQVLSNPAASQETGVNATVTLGADNSAIKTLRVNEPPSLGPNFPSFGQQSDQCPASAAPTAVSVFDATNCPAQSVVGSMTINTPLLPTPLTGTVYLINKSPLPWIGVKFDQPGIAVRLTGVTSTPQVDPACDPLTQDEGFCQTQISILFNNVPEVPISSIAMSLNGPSRTGIGGTTLSGKILVVATPNDPTCVPSSPARAVFTPFSGTPALTIDQPISITGCLPH